MPAQPASTPNNVNHIRHVKHVRHVKPVASLVVGTVASAATTGALVAIGHRLGSVGIPFAAVSAALFHRTANGGESGLVLTGIVLHVVMVMLWSAVFVWLVSTVRWRAFAAAIVVAIGSFVLSWLIGWSTERGVATVLALGDRILVAIVLGVSLIVGMRFALLRGEMPD